MRKICDWLDRKLVPVVRRRAWKRLAADISKYKEELEGHANCGRSIAILKAADQAAKDGDIDAGWKLLQTARRLELAATTSPAKLEATAIEIRKEAAEKLNSWRKEAVKELLTTARGVALDPQKVCAAALLCDDHFNNEAYRGGLRRSNATRLAISLLLAFLALLWLGKSGYLLAAVTAPAEPGNLFKVLLTLAVFGWLGATVSAVIDVPKPGAPTRIPELVSTFQVTVLRVLMGPASAIVLYFVMQTQLSKMIFKQDVTNEGYIFLVIAFAAGFSERLVLRVIQAFDGKSRT